MNSKSEKPNIIFIMADQLAAGFVGCYGSGVNSTPVLDKMATEGRRYNRCYTTCPVCAPNRATIFTGRSPYIHGITSNNYNLTTDMPTVFNVLQQNNYRTGGFGKFHLTAMGLPLPKNFNYLGFNESLATEDPKVSPWINWVKEKYPEHYENALAVCWNPAYCKEYGENKENLSDAISKANLKIRQPLRDKSEWRSMHSSPLDKEAHQTRWITDISIDFMERHLIEHSKKPFCCYLSFVDPHDPYDPPKPYDTMFDPMDMPEPIPPVWEEKDNPGLKLSQKFGGFDKIAHNIPAIKKLRALYHGSICFIDDQVSRILKFIDEKKIADNTIIIFTTDHGDMMGNQALIGKGDKFFDSSVRCPLIVYGADIKPEIINDLTCSLDFFPTICELAGIDDLPPQEGKSFAVAKKSGEKPQWKMVTIEFCNENPLQNVRGIITDDNWRFTIFNSENQGEMFNLDEDPDEQKNLFYNPDFTEKKLRLFELLTRAFMRPGRIPQYRNLPEKDGFKYYNKPGSPCLGEKVPFQHKNVLGVKLR